jgi:hypothetical protein
MEEFKTGDIVVFGRRRGEQTLGTVIKVNRKSIKIRQEEARGTQKSHAVGSKWTVGRTLVRHATEAEAQRLRDRDASKAEGKSQVPPRKPLPGQTKAPEAPEVEAPTAKVLNPDVISDGSKLDGSAMPRILKLAQTLVGKKIAQIGYIREHGQCWPIVVLDDGTELVAQADDEANGPGSLSFGSELLCQIY